VFDDAERPAENTTQNTTQRAKPGPLVGVTTWFGVTTLTCYRMSCVSQVVELRGLAVAEFAIVIALALTPLPDAIPLALPLFAAGSVAKWRTGHSWGHVVTPTTLQAGVGVAVGLAALILALLVGTPVVESVSQRAIEWSSFPLVRGNASMLGGVVLLVVLYAVGFELALRGWLVERVLEVSPGKPGFPVMVGALAEAVLTPGDLAIRVGAGLFGAGLGWIYVAGGRNVFAPMMARITFSMVAVVLESLRVIG
jgi:hypothetical protein